MMRILTLTSQAIIAAFFLAGCASIVGKTESTDPPRLIPAKGLAIAGEGLLTWDRPSAFGQVPENLKPLGDTACLIARVDLEAIGYHSRALDESGKPMSGGGYYCAVKLNGDQPDIRPPRLVKLDSGVIGWDRPSAFGRIPERLSPKAKQVCEAIASDLVAYGYHPWARDLDGKGIEGGGFFCGPIKK